MKRVDIDEDEISIRETVTVQQRSDGKIVFQDFLFFINFKCLTISENTLF